MSDWSDDGYALDCEGKLRDAAIDRRDLLDEASGGDDAAADCGLFFALPPALAHEAGEVVMLKGASDGT